MAKAFHVVHWQDIQPGSKWYEHVTNYDILICTDGVSADRVRAVAKPGAKLFVATNFRAVPQSRGREGSFIYDYRKALDRKRYYIRDKSIPDGRLRVGLPVWDIALLKPGINIAKKQVEALVKCFHNYNRGWDGIYVDDAGDYLPPHLVERLKQVNYVNSETLALFQCRWRAKVQFYFMYLRYLLGHRFSVIAQMFEPQENAECIHDPRRETALGSNWPQYVDGITVERAHSDRINEAGEIGASAIIRNWIEQAKLNTAMGRPNYSIDWSNRWEAQDVVAKGIVKNEWEPEEVPIESEVIPSPTLEKE
jgi:hypothetical protein